MAIKNLPAVAERLLECLLIWLSVVYSHIAKIEIPPLCLNRKKAFWLAWTVMVERYVRIQATYSQWGGVSGEFLTCSVVSGNRMDCILACNSWTWIGGSDSKLDFVAAWACKCNIVLSLCRAADIDVVRCVELWWNKVSVFATIKYATFKNAQASDYVQT